MNPLRNLFLLTFFFIWLVSLTKAQDFHLSQMDACPLYINPGLTGVRLEGEGKFRLGANYREQGNKALGLLNTTSAVGFDTPIDDRFSVGQFIINHNSSNGSFNLLNVMLSGAYNIIRASEKINQCLTMGIQLGFMQSSVNTGNFKFESQYSELSADGFDQNIPSGEYFGTQNFFMVDANAGIYYKFVSANKKYIPFFGLSLYHLTQPNQSYTGVESIVPMRFVLTSGTHIKFSSEFSLFPQFIYMRQAAVNEFSLTLLSFTQIVAEKNFEALFGCTWRYNDAVVAHIGFKAKNNIIRLSYDFTTSYLKSFTNARNAVELSILFLGITKAKPVENKGSDTSETDTK